MKNENRKWRWWNVTANSLQNKQKEEKNNDSISNNNQEKLNPNQMTEDDPDDIEIESNEILRVKTHYGWPAHL